MLVVQFHETNAKVRSSFLDGLVVEPLKRTKLLRLGVIRTPSEARALGRSAG